MNMASDAYTLLMDILLNNSLGDEFLFCEIQQKNDFAYVN